MGAKIDFQHYALYKGLGNTYKWYRRGREISFTFLLRVSISYYIECKLEARRTVQINQHHFKFHKIQVHGNACVVSNVHHRSCFYTKNS